MSTIFRRNCTLSALSLLLLSAPLASKASSDLSKATNEAKSGQKTRTQTDNQTGKHPGNQANNQASSTSKDVLRLSKSIKPISYKLRFEPDLEKFTYTGTETIDLSIAEASKTIRMNLLDQEIASAELEAMPASGDSGKKSRTEKSESGSKKWTARVEMDPANEQVVFNFTESIQPGKYRLHVKFSGILNDQLRGFYRSYYKDKNGEKHWLCSTQMEPSDARRMFPCFDEPEFKASFQITAVIDPKLSAISNAAIKETRQSEDGKKKVVVFEPSPKMSTYLLLLVVGEFKSTPERQACGVPIRVWAPAGQEEMGKYSLDVSCEVMDYLSGYFGIKYPGNKLDLIAIPDFAPGAMENLGAITFKDSILLIDEKTASNFAKRSALSIIAHEMAHQWFGDLVTNRWWDDLWLNEAFATWAATKTEAALRPQWRVRSKAVNEREDAMNIDELASTRPIHAHVGNPKQASEMFDAITYEKGSAVLRMLEVYAGEKNFQKGVHDYLEAHKFDNATSEDLWQSIAAATKGMPVSEIMQSWIMQGGFPQIKTGEVKDKKLELSQEKFLIMPEARAVDASWFVPIVLRDLAGQAANASQTKTFMLKAKSDTFSVPDGWTLPLVNAGASGFYRVLYQQEQLGKVMDNFNKLSPEEKLCLNSDIATFAYKGTLPVEKNLDLMLKVKDESDPVVLNKLLLKFSGPRKFMDKDSLAAYEKFVQAYLNPLKNRYGWEEQKGEDETVKDLRADLIRILGTYGNDEKTIKEARELYSKYLKNRESVSADIIGSVLNIVAYHGGKTEYDEMKAAAKKAANPQEEKRFLMALAQFRQSELQAETLNMALSPEARTTDGVSLLTSMLSNRDSNEQAWKFTKENWQAIGKKFPPRFNKRIVAACDSLDKPDLEKDVNEFFNTHPVEMGKAAVARCKELLRVAVIYRESNEGKIKDWVKKQAASVQ